MSTWSSRRLLIVATALAGSGQGCHTFHAPQVAPVSAKGLSIYVAEAKVAHTDNDCETRKSAPANATVRAIATAARQSGWEVVTDPSMPVDIVADTDIDLEYCSSQADVGGSAVIVFKSNGRVIEEKRVERKWRGEGILPADEWGIYIGNRAVDALNRSPALAAFARSEHARVAANGAKSPATGAAAPAAATAGNAPRGGSVDAFVAAAPQATAYALVIGVEKYRDVPSPTGARHDAERFAALARQMLGISDEHIRLALDERATRGDIVKHLQWLKANVKAGGRIYFYFSGHGAPDPTAGTSYLLPYDGDPKALDESALPLSDVLGKLGETSARDVLAVVDSCFSGAGGRSVLPAGVRPLVRVKEANVGGRVALLSAAAGSEISGAASDGSGGLFTTWMTRALASGEADINGDGQISLREIHDWVKPRVVRDAKHDNRDQTPTLSMGSGAGSADDFIIAWGVGKR